jgi:hypothetical protein
MEAILFNSAFIVGGVYFGFRNIRLLRDERALRDYMQSSPSAARWVSKYGIERATQMAREKTIPLGIAIAAAMVGLGAWNLSRIYL